MPPMTPMRLRRVPLLAVAVIGVALGGVFLALPPALGDVQPSPLASDSALVAPPLPAGDPALAEDVVIANVFSPRRTPPTSRYTPSDAAIDSAGGMVADAVVEAAGDAAGGEPILLGTVVGTRGTQALLQLDPSGGPARLYAEGERDGGYRVLSIAPRAVTLQGPRGRVTLRLAPPPDQPSDPQEPRP